ncbi:MAG: nucleotidyl transferase AbiEii/AbiGii toxin family protein [Bacteroidetes bacterium]|nr:nucleotidyl transferase AbiEii/AbiGii toxin family protein [Bacteroidota bacterium]
MIQLSQILGFYPPILRDDPSSRKYLLKEYIQLLILDYLATTKYMRKLVFIGGTCLRLVKGIDRFSEDLDFDCKDVSADDFMRMTNEVITYLNRFGLKAEARDKTSDKITVFRRNIYFPDLLQEMQLSGHKDERFLIKIECQDQQVSYNSEKAVIHGCGFFFPFPVPSDPVLCSMKISALLSRQKGRDFYDLMFLLSFTLPDYSFLAARKQIRNSAGLKQALTEMLSRTDLKKKARDFEHLLFQKTNNLRILNFPTAVETIK